MNICNQSDYNMTLWLIDNHLNKETGDYDFFVNIFDNEGHRLILIDNKGYSDAIIVTLHTKPPTLIKILNDRYNNCEKCFKEYLRTYFMEMALLECSKNEELKDKPFNKLSTYFADEGNRNE